MLSLDQIREKLSTVPEQSAPDDHRSPTAVALVLTGDLNDLSVLFIERAHDERDPWSGNIGFPGGRMGAGDPDLKGAAERETREEVGIPLGAADLIGRLPDIVGAHLPVRVACFVYFLPAVAPLQLNPEVRDAFWVQLSALVDPARNLTAEVTFAGERMLTPAIRLPQQGKPVLWGITYRLVRLFLEMVS